MRPKVRDILPVTRSKEEAKKNYDRLSGRYDRLAGRAEKECGWTGLRMLDVQEGESVLEIGFGTGECIVELTKAVGESGRVYGVDISEGMRESQSGSCLPAGMPCTCPTRTPLWMVCS